MKIEYLSVLTEDVKEQLLSVWEAAVRVSHHFLTEEDIAYYRPLIRDQYLQAVKLYVIRDEQGEIKAFMGLSDELVEMLFVHPTAQGKGLGTALMNYAYHNQGISKVDVNEDNHQASRFYQSMGYQIIGRDATDGTGRPFPILHLQRQTAEN